MSGIELIGWPALILSCSGLWGCSPLCRRSTPLQQKNNSFVFASCPLPSFGFAPAKKAGPIKQQTFLYLLMSCVMFDERGRNGGELGVKPITNNHAIWNSLNFNGVGSSIKPFLPFHQTKKFNSIKFLSLIPFHSFFWLNGIDEKKVL